MGRRHRDGRNRHVGAPNRVVARPALPRPPREARVLGAPSDARQAHAEPSPRPIEAAEVRAPVDAPTREVVHPIEPAADVDAAAVAVRPAATANGHDRPESVSVRSGATPAQLRRFIKSRPYIPLHELRRRFGLNGHDDDVVAVDVGEQRVFVGLPPDEGRMLGELIRQGEVGCELALDPASPVVVGVFPIRPVTRV